MTDNWQSVGTLLDTGEDLIIPGDILDQHLYVLGRTRVGKTTFLASLFMAALARGEGVFFLDPHGDIGPEIIDACSPELRKRITYIDLADRDYPIPLNIFEAKPGDDKDLICSSVVGFFKRQYESWGPQLEDLLRALTFTMLDHQFLEDDRFPEGDQHKWNATLQDAHDILYNRGYRHAFYDFIASPILRSFWEDLYDTLGGGRGQGDVTRQQVLYSSSTANKLRRLLLNPLLFDITTNRDKKNAINFREMMDNRQALIVSLAKGSIGDDNAQVLGSLLLSRLVDAAFSRTDIPVEERREKVFNVIVDEIHSFTTDNFKLLLSEAGKYGVRLTIAHQERHQLDIEMRAAALNCGSLVCFQLIGSDAREVGLQFDSTPRPVRVDYERVMQDFYKVVLPVERQEADAVLAQQVHKAQSRIRELMQKRDEDIADLEAQLDNGKWIRTAIEKEFQKARLELEDEIARIEKERVRFESEVSAEERRAQNIAIDAQVAELRKKIGELRPTISARVESELRGETQRLAERDGEIRKRLKLLPEEYVTATAPLRAQIDALTEARARLRERQYQFSIQEQQEQGGIWREDDKVAPALYGDETPKPAAPAKIQVYPDPNRYPPPLRLEGKYRAVPVMGSYAEREREIANELTQLPRFTAMVRLSDGQHLRFRTRRLPGPSLEKDRHVRDRLEVTRRELAVPPDQRRSQWEAEYFKRLRRQEAVDFEAQAEPDADDLSPLVR